MGLRKTAVYSSKDGSHYRNFNSFIPVISKGDALPVQCRRKNYAVRVTPGLTSRFSVTVYSELLQI
jgi:hypothetical protein